MPACGVQGYLPMPVWISVVHWSSSVTCSSWFLCCLSILERIKETLHGFVFVWNVSFPDVSCLFSPWWQSASASSVSCTTFRNNCSSVVVCPTSKPEHEDHPLWVACHCLFNIFTILSLTTFTETHSKMLHAISGLFKWIFRAHLPIYQSWHSYQLFCCAQSIWIGIDESHRQHIFSCNVVAIDKV